MNKKSITLGLVIAIVVAVVFGTFFGLFGKNDLQNWQILQGVTGKMNIRTQAGVFPKWFAKPYIYPKVQRVYFSKEVSEGGTLDESCNVIFADKGTASFSSMVLYNPPYIKAGEAYDKNNKKNFKDGEVARFHQLCRGDIKIADKTVLARLKEYSRIVSSTQNASDCVEDQAEYIDAIRQRMKNDVTLKSYGIDIKEVALSDISFDEKTLSQFTKQQDAILASKEAEAKKIQFEMKKLETEADYAQKIAEEKGKAEMQMMKQVTDAERDKKLAEIDAQKKAAVAELVKKEALIIASKAKEVAEIEKQESLVRASKLKEVADIAAEEAEAHKKAIILAAEGRQKAIQLSGAITEKEKVLAQIAADRDVKIASYYSQIQSPSTVFLGGSEGNGANYFNNMLSYTLGVNAKLIPTAPIEVNNK